VFVSPSASLILVLGVLLISSAVGGLLAQRLPLVVATIALIPVLVACLRLPDWTMRWQFDPWWTGATAVAMVGCVGMTMGVFFPGGLLLAQSRSLHEKIPHFFAINTLSGTLATVLSLYLGIRWGYSWTLVAAFALYVIATVTYYRAARSAA
jgi:hypothetical protein